MALRPSFATQLSCSGRTAVERLQANLATRPVVVKVSRPPGGGSSGSRDDLHVVLTVPPAERHFWSPWLTVELSPRDGATHVQSTFSPHPSVWTGFAFAYLVLAAICAVSLVIAGSAALLPDSDQSWALWIAGGAALAMIGMWWASQVGQRLAAAQMDSLRGELTRALDGCRDAPPA
jgi:hypothetical protein